MARVIEAAKLSTPSLCARSAQLQTDVASLIERARDLQWWARQLCTRSATPLRIRGGAAVDDAATVLSLITRVDLCQDCIAHKSGIPRSRVDGLLTTIAGTIALSVETRPCSTCF